MKKQTLLGLLTLSILLLSMSGASAESVAFFNVTNANADASTLSFPHTAGGSDRLVIVGVSLEDGDLTKEVANVTYGGILMTEIANVPVGSTPPRVQMFELVAPVTTQQTVLITIEAGNAQKMNAGAISFTDVNQTNTTGVAVTAIGTSTSASVSVSSTSGDLVLDTVGALDTLTVGVGQTERWNDAMFGSGSFGAGSTEAGSGSITMSYTVGSSVDWAIAAVNINQVPDNLLPTVFDLVPVNGTEFDMLVNPTIKVNVTDNIAVDTVIANITLPNGTVNQLSLPNAGGDIFNATFSNPALLGIYTVLFIANDTSGNVNDTESTQFVVTMSTPGVTIIQPANTTFTSRFNIPIELQFDSGTTICEWQLIGVTSRNSITCVPTAISEFIAPTEGSFTFIAFAGNGTFEDNSSIIFTVDVPELTTGNSIILFGLTFFYLLTAFFFIFMSYRFDDRWNPLSIFFIGFGSLFLLAAFHSVTIHLRDFIGFAPSIALSEIIFFVTMISFAFLALIGVIFLLFFTIRELKFQKWKNNQDDGWDYGIGEQNRPRN